jgi:GT2 family glycosyltransferase
VRSASVARNIGIKKAKGTILLFLDSDVVLYPQYVQKIVEVFKKYDAVGVQGWIVNLKPVTFPLVQAFKRMFFIGSYRRNGYKFYEYPFPLTGIINCEAFRGANMAFRSDIFKEFEFDESLRCYSYNEDLLLSYSVFRKYPKGLFSTPYAKCVHKISKGGRMKSSDVKYHMNRCRRYVLTKLFGVRGIMLYHWQNLGILSRESALKLVKNLGVKSLIRIDIEEE